MKLSYIIFFIFTYYIDARIILRFPNERKSSISPCEITFHCLNSMFGDFIARIYPIEIETKETTDTSISPSYLELHLEIDSEGWLRTKRHKR